MQDPEKFISNKKIKTERELADGLLRALSSTVCKDPSRLRVIASVLMHSSKTVQVAEDILTEYGKYIQL